VRRAPHPAKASLADNFVKVIVIFDVGVVLQIKVLLGCLYAIALLGSPLSPTVVQESLKVLTRELNQVFRLAAYHLFYEVLEDAGKLVRDLDLLGREDEHIANVGHFDSNYYKDCYNI